jgi:hypothetical protein
LTYVDDFVSVCTHLDAGRFAARSANTRAIASYPPLSVPLGATAQSGSAQDAANKSKE